MLILARAGRKNSRLFLPLHIKRSSMIFLSVVRVFLVYSLPFKSIFQRAFSLYFYGFASSGACGRRKILFMKYKNRLTSASSLTGHRTLVLNSIICIMTDSNYTVRECLETLPGKFTAKVVWHTIKIESSVYKKQLIFSQQSSPIFFFFITWTPPYMHNRTLYLIIIIIIFNTYIALFL